MSQSEVGAENGTPGRVVDPDPHLTSGASVDRRVVGDLDSRAEQHQA